MNPPVDHAAATTADLHRFRLDLSYMGHPFSGFQSQPNGQAVQDHLEKALQVLLRHPLRIKGASRTDSGVHAEHQVACFATDRILESYPFLRNLNALLPAEIMVNQLTQVPWSFDPMRHSCGKIYRYLIWRGHKPHPFLAPYVWHLRADISVDDLRAASLPFVGTNDFSSFCNAGTSVRHYVRTIYGIEVYERGPLCEIWFSGDGFLKQMIRIMVGSLVSVTRTKSSPQAITDMLAAQDRRSSALTAPAQGLALIKVFYEPLPDLASFIAEYRKTSAFLVSLPS